MSARQTDGIKALTLDVFGTRIDFRGSIMRELRAAARHGLKTAFVRRPHEHGRNTGKELDDDPAFTINADDFIDLTAQLGC